MTQRLGFSDARKYALGSHHGLLLVRLPQPSRLALLDRRGDDATLHHVYNFGCWHLTLRVTPAMEAGIATHVWSIEETVGLLD